MLAPSGSGSIDINFIFYDAMSFVLPRLTHRTPLSSLSGFNLKKTSSSSTITSGSYDNLIKGNSNFTYSYI